jgi:hypothetical protein
VHSTIVIDAPKESRAERKDQKVEDIRHARGLKQKSGGELDSDTDRC